MENKPPLLQPIDTRFLEIVSTFQSWLKNVEIIVTHFRLNFPHVAIVDFVTS